MKRSLLLLFLPVLLTADGGKLILSGTDHGETLSVFADPYPVRAGEACDLSVLVQKGDTPLLEGAVAITIAGASFSAAHALATNKLLFAANVTLSNGGTFRLSASHGPALISGELTVEPPSPALLSYWPYFALVPASIGLFALNRHLKWRHSRRFSASRQSRRPAPPARERPE